MFKVEKTDFQVDCETVMSRMVSSSGMLKEFTLYDEVNQLAPRE